ncbi:MAG: VanZ family protein [Bacteroidales bacterium]|nr:VanZ family protein [Bacteroidales bacterium]
MARLTRHIYPGLLCGVIIMILCGLPGSYFPKVITFWEWLGPDKLVHLLMFASLSFFTIWGYREEYCHNNKSYRIKLQLIVFLITIAYGAITEVLQANIFHGRYGSIYDFLADVIGCILGILIFKLIFRKKMIKNSSEIK